MLRALLSRILGTLRRRRLDEEFDEEIQCHLEMLAERFIRQGMEPVDARRAARRQFGGVTQMKENLRERSVLPALDVLVLDVRHALRQFRKDKRFTATAALTLALGIGATTAVFAVLDAVVLRPLPYATADRLAAFGSGEQRGLPGAGSLSYPTFFDFRRENRVFDHLVSYRDARFTLSDSLPPIQVVGEIVSWDLFPLLGVQLELGRGFLAEEEEPGQSVVVLSHSLWTARFGGDPGILGRSVRMNGRPFTVVGVAKAGFQFPVDLPAVQLWVTLAEDAAATHERGSKMLGAIGRLKPGVTADQAQARMDMIASGLARHYPDHKRSLAATSVVSELERVAGRSRKALWTLLGAVALLLLIACANVANLLLARGTERGREFVLRSALGASRVALMRQLLVESLALGVIGTAGGIVLAWVAIKGFLPLVGDALPRIAQAGIDGRVLVFSGLVALSTSVVFGLAPAFGAVGADPAGALKAGAVSIARGRHRFRSALVVAQITLSLVLLVGAELLIASFVQMARQDPGFRPDHLLTFDVGLPETRRGRSDRLLRSAHRASPRDSGSARSGDGHAATAPGPRDDGGLLRRGASGFSARPAAFRFCHRHSQLLRRHRDSTAEGTRL